MSHPLSHRYQDFSASNGAQDPSTTAIPENDVEDMQLASFEAGYQAGWEDAIKAQKGSSGQAAIDVAQNLQDMSFTHRDAFLKLSKAMQPLLMQMVDKVLPNVARQVLGLHILQQINSVMEDQAATALEIVVSPDQEESIAALLKAQAKVPFTLRADPLVGPGQAQLRTNSNGQDINLDAVLSGMSDAIQAFYQQPDLESSDG